MKCIHRVTAGDIVFVNHPKYYDKALNSAATIVLIDQEVECPEGKALLISEDPFRDFNLINTYFTRTQDFKEERHNLEVGDATIIHSSVVIGNDVKIGDNCMIHPNVVGDRTVIGNNVIIQSGTVLGGDAFYYRKTANGFEKLQIRWTCCFGGRCRRC
jgi:UDP-3-O-[3-hydroxymyristoyl] glucosamine N-acyltransferase